MTSSAADFGHLRRFQLVFYDDGARCAGAARRVLRPAAATAAGEITRRANDARAVVRRRTAAKRGARADAAKPRRPEIDAILAGRSIDVEHAARRDRRTAAAATRSAGKSRAATAARDGNERSETCRAARAAVVRRVGAGRAARANYDGDR